MIVPSFRDVGTYRLTTNTRSTDPERSDAHHPDRQSAPSGYELALNNVTLCGRSREAMPAKTRS
jgi:hypothetical protein